MTPPTSSAAEFEALLADLAAVGYPVRSLPELINTGSRYRPAVPVLVSWLERASDPKLKEWIARALSVPWAKNLATRPMISAFRELPLDADRSGMGLRWTIGNGLDVLYDDSEFLAYCELAVAVEYGKARQMIVLALGKSKRSEVVPLLVALTEDSDVDGHATKALARLAAPSARAAFEAKLLDDRNWVRQEARKGLARLATT